MDRASELRKALTAYRTGDYSDTPAGDVLKVIVAAAEQHLAEHPADSEEPVTAEWLASVGFAREMQSAGTRHLTFRRGGVVVTRWEPAESNDRRWSVQKYHGDGPEWLPACLTPTTRKAVRRLLAALTP